MEKGTLSTDGEGVSGDGDGETALSDGDGPMGGGGGNDEGSPLADDAGPGDGDGKASLLDGEAPLLEGGAPFPDGEAPLLEGEAPSLGDEAPSPGGEAPLPDGEAPSLGGEAPSLGGEVPSLDGGDDSGKGPGFPLSEGVPPTEGDDAEGGDVGTASPEASAGVGGGSSSEPVRLPEPSPIPGAILQILSSRTRSSPWLSPKGVRVISHVSVTSPLGLWQTLRNRGQIDRAPRTY